MEQLDPAEVTHVHSRAWQQPQGAPGRIPESPVHESPTQTPDAAAAAANPSGLHFVAPVETTGCRGITKSCLQLPA